MHESVIAARLLGISWADYWDEEPAAVLSARMAASLHFAQIERRAREGRPLADGESVRAARKDYLGQYWLIRRRKLEGK